MQTSLSESIWLAYWRCCQTFMNSHWLPAAEIPSTTLCKNGYSYKVLLSCCQTRDGEWWGGRCAGVCGKRGFSQPILDDVLWVSQSTQVSWMRPGHPDCSLGGQWLQCDHTWRCNWEWAKINQFHTILAFQNCMCNTESLMSKNCINTLLQILCYIVCAQQ